MITNKLRPNTLAYLNIPEDMDSELIRVWMQRLGVNNKDTTKPFIIMGPIAGLSGHDLVAIPNGKTIMVEGIKEVASTLYRDVIHFNMQTAVGDILSNSVMKMFIDEEITSNAFATEALKLPNSLQDVNFKVYELLLDMEAGKITKAPLRLYFGNLTLTGTLTLESENNF